jgi:hypothetical protein
MGLSSRRKWAHFYPCGRRAYPDGQNPLLSDRDPRSYVGGDPHQRVEAPRVGDRGLLVR